MAGCQTNRSSTPFPALQLAGLTFLTVFGLFGLANLSPPQAAAHHLMCGVTVEKHTQTVSIDPNLAGTGLTQADVLAAFSKWNNLFVKYHGFPIFTEHRGDWWEADVLLTAHGASRTWVANSCLPGFEQRGNNHSIVFIGTNDSWRNRVVLAHELGHALGLGDHGTAVQFSAGHVGIQPCSLSYIGVMSYCTSPQAWFLDINVHGITFDGRLIKEYW